MYMLLATVPGNLWPSIAERMAPLRPACDSNHSIHSTYRFVSNTLPGAMSKCDYHARNAAHSRVYSYSATADMSGKVLALLTNISEVSCGPRTLPKSFTKVSRVKIQQLCRLLYVLHIRWLYVCEMRDCSFPASEKVCRAQNFLRCTVYHATVTFYFSFICYFSRKRAMRRKWIHESVRLFDIKECVC